MNENRSASLGSTSLGSSKRSLAVATDRGREGSNWCETKTKEESRWLLQKGTLAGVAVNNNRV